MKKYLAILTLTVATTAHANWFTQMFESEYDRNIRLCLERSANGGYTNEELEVHKTTEILWEADLQARLENIRIARRVYGEGNPDQLEILGQQIKREVREGY